MSVTRRSKVALIVVAALAAFGTLAWALVVGSKLSGTAGDVPPCSSGEACQAHVVEGRGAAAQPVRGKPRMLVFSSRACPVCERMAPRVQAAERACGAEADVMHLDVDDDAGEGLAALYGVPLLPSYVSVDASGREVARLVGLQEQERLEEALAEVRGARCAAVDAPVHSSGGKG
jgi:hypothetical protein